MSVIAVIILALGIGANTTIFGVVNALLFAPLPYKDADRLVYLLETAPNLRSGGATSFPTFLDWEKQSQAFAEMAAFQYEACNLNEGKEPEPLSGIRLSDGALALLGVTPVMGRELREDDFSADAGAVVLLSYKLWQSRFGGDPEILGGAVSLNGRSCAVIGVMPAGLKMGIALGFEPEIWMPMRSGYSEDRNSRSVLVLARLQPGVTLERAKADMEVISRRLGESHPESSRGWTAIVSPIRGEVDTIAYVLLILMVGSILGLVCANVTSLLLSRACGRTQEMAIRGALGAGRWRLARQLLTENMILVGLGSVLGVMASWWACRLITLKFADTNIGMLAIRIDTRVLGATLGLLVLAGVIVALVPALQISRTGMIQPLKSGRKSLVGTASKPRLRGLFVALEAALSVLLLTSAGLAVKSWFHLWDADLGFQPERVVTMRISLPGDRYPSGQQQVAFFQEFLSRLQNVPGIQSAGLTSDLPTGSPQREFFIEGRSMPDSGGGLSARFTIVSEEYFAAMTLPLKAGRRFSRLDIADSPPVAIVNEAMARRHWNGQNPTGGRLRVAGVVRTIIGVAGDVRSIPLSLKPVPEIFVPYAQIPSAEMALVVQTTRADPLGFAPIIKKEIQAVDPEQAVSKIRTMEQVCASNLGVIRLGTSVLVLVALGALILSSLGLYGVLSYSVQQRTNELGIRMAIGARALDITRLVLRQGMVLVLYGIVPGMAAAMVLGRVLSNSLFGVGPIEPLLLAGISLLLILVAFAACYIPARRAARIDPMQALRRL